MNKGCQTNRLGDVCRIDRRQARHKGLPYVGLEHIESGTGKFVGVLEPMQVKSNTFAFDAKSVLFGRLRPYLKKVLLPSFPGHCSTEIFPLQPSAVLAAEYLHYWFLQDSVITAIDATCTGARMPRANMDAVMDFPIPVPPLPEQRRIVAILDEAFEGIAAAKANAEKNLRNAREAFVAALEQQYGFAKEGWREITVGQAADEGIIAKPFDGNHGEIHPKRADYTPSGVPFVMACDLKDGEVDTQTCTFISPRTAERLRVGRAKSGDVLLSHKGTIGRTAILSTNADYVMLTPQVTAYRILDQSRLDTCFLYYYFKSHFFQQALTTAAADGSTRAYVGITKQRGLPLRIPPLAQQKQTVSSLRAVDLEVALLEQALARKPPALDELKASLLHQAFTGQL